ncbi:MAG: competence/damage-inducible protein A [Vicinamibacterales bacterium]
MPDLHSAEIIAVGSELLTPHRVDTNSLFLTGRLNELGIVVHAKTVVGDDRADLATAVRGALSRADLVIATGGLGPTDDDLTRDVVAQVLGRTLAEDPQIVEGMVARFARRGVAMPAVNRKQAQVPQGAVVLPNSRGTAPGLLLETDGRFIVLLPGPPREMQPMFDEQVAPRLAAMTAGRQVRRRVIKITGRSESQVEEVAYPIYSRLTSPVGPVQTTILASPGQIELHLSASGSDVVAIDRTLADGVAQLSEALGSIVFSVDGRSLETVVGDLLHARSLHLAVAESCTGGLLLGRLTEVPGSSDWVVGGVVAYSNSVKVQTLGVGHDLLEAHGAVSEPVARAMAEGVRLLGADVGASITGIAGPGGGSPEKPVGTVVVAVAYRETVARTFLFPGDRETVRRHSTSAALDMIRRSLL